MEIAQVRTRVVVALAVLVLLAGVTRAGAQQAVSAFEQIQFKVEEGDAVELTDAAGQVVRGELRKATDTEVWLDVRGDVRKYREADVTQINARAFDKLWEGALIGTAVGAVFGAVLMSQADCYEDECVVFALGFAGAGAGIGIGIDAMIRRFTQVYSAPGRALRTQVMLAPIARNGARGAAVAIRF
jgi:hypothetical protein